MGFATSVVNAHDGKPYVVSTTKNPWGIWEAVVFHRGLLGLPGKAVCGVCPITQGQMSRLNPYDMLAPEQRLGKRIVFLPVETVSEANMREIHAIVVGVAEESPSEQWEGFFARQVGQYLDAIGLRLKTERS